MKTCYICRLSQPLENFHKDTSRPDGHRYQCKTCLRQQRQQHREHYNLLQRQSHQRNREHRNLLQRQSYQRNRACVLAKTRARSRQYQQLHPEKARLQKTKRRARQKETVKEAISLEILAARDRWVCHICKKKVTRKTWSHDHLIPISAGGETTYLNVALAHHRCNSQRGPGRSPAQLRLLP
jgi:HNH endonuclease